MNLNEKVDNLNTRAKIVVERLTALQGDSGLIHDVNHHLNSIINYDYLLVGNYITQERLDKFESVIKKAEDWLISIAKAFH